MTNHFELPVLISVKASKWLKFWLYIIHLLVIPVILITCLAWPVIILLTTTVAISLYFVNCNYIRLQGKNSVVRIMLNDADEWWLATAHGDSINATLLPAAFVHPLLISLPFQAQGRKFTVILTPDIVNSDTLRRLRVRLRFSRHSGKSEPGSGS